MRIIRSAILAVACVSGCWSVLLAQVPDPTEVLAAAREALGGDSNLSAVKTLVATGRTRQLRGNNLVPIEFEINCELPDRYVRKDEIPAQDTDLTVTGFSGDTVIQFPLPSPGRGGPPPGDGRGRGGAAPGPTPGPAPRLAIVKQEFARLMLGAFATSFPSYPLTFKYAALGEAPEGKADILDVAGPGDFSARFVVQQDTHLPVMLTWQLPGADGKPTEYRIYYADFRTVGRVKWPFRIRRAVGGVTVEETTFDQVRVNVKIDPRKFETPK